MEPTTAFEVRGRLRPILKWAGGKSGVLPELISHFPTRFERYHESFVGAAATFLALRDGIPASLNDSNPDLIELYGVVRDHPKELSESLVRLSERYSETFYYELRSQVPSEPVARVARTIFLNKCGFNGLYRLNSQGGFNVPFGKRPSCPSLYDPENLMRVSQRLSTVVLTIGDFESAISKAGRGDFVYCDPPYEPLSRTAAFTSYTASGFSQRDQMRLQTVCESAVERGAMVAISNSAAPFILDLYKHWDVRTIRARRAINSKGSARGEIEEVVAVAGYTV